MPPVGKSAAIQMSASRQVRMRAVAAYSNVRKSRD